MTKLDISPERSLPLKFLELRVVVWGGSGAGKTTGSRVMFEAATKAGVVAGAVDLKADWWGLKSSADGKSAGIPIVVFGGEHADIPISPDAGAVTADVIVDLRQPWVLDLEQFTKGQQIRFLAAFLERLYDRNREPMVVFFDEADRYAPQKPMSPEANIALGATEDIAKRGRKHGIFPVFITQRNQALNKDVSELCDAAFVYRTPGPRAQAAALDWFGSKATAEQMAEVQGAIASLETGEAFLCSADPKVRIFQRLNIRKPETFDSSATPEIGKRVIVPKVLAKADLAAIEQRMAATIAEVKAKDPRALQQALAAEQRAHTATLKLVDAYRNRLTTAEAAVKIETKRVEVPVLAKSSLKAITTATHKLDAAATRFLHLIGETDKLRDIARESREGLAVVYDELHRITSAPSAASVPSGDVTGAAVRAGHTRQPLMAATADESRAHSGTARTTTIQTPGNDGNSRAGGAVAPRRGDRANASDDPGGALSGTHRRILAALAWRELTFGVKRTAKPTVAALIGVSFNGGFRSRLSEVRAKGLIDYPDQNTVALTAAGAEMADPGALPQTREELWEQLKKRLTGTQWRILSTLIDVYPQALGKADVAARIGVEFNGGFRSRLSEVKTLGLVEYPSQSEVVASPIAMLEAGR